MQPEIERRVEALLGQMSLAEKVGQMTQVEKNSLTPDEVAQYAIGFVLSGGGGNPTPNNPTAWGATIFPHDIGLGATRDVELVTRIARATAQELPATNVHWALAPAASVPQDLRWGRTYEGLSDVLFGAVPFTGALPYMWPRRMTQLRGESDDSPLFPLNYGLQTAATHPKGV